MPCALGHHSASTGGQLRRKRCRSYSETCETSLLCIRQIAWQSDRSPGRATDHLVERQTAWQSRSMTSPAPHQQHDRDGAALEAEGTT